MRKLSDYLGKPLFFGADAEFLGVIRGVLCDRRIKNVEYLILSPPDGVISDDRYFTLRNVKTVTDSSVILSKKLCIKNADALGRWTYTDEVIGSRAYDGDGKFYGKVEDILVSDEDKKIVSLITELGEIDAAKVSGSASGVLSLHGEGTAPRKGKPKIALPQEDFAVEILNATVVPANNETEVASTGSPKEDEVSSAVDATIEVAKVTALPLSVAVATPQWVMPQRVISNYRFLIGRVVTKNIYNARRERIISYGALITAEVVKTAHAAGKLIELTLYSKA